jgi:hypothetical protein
MARRDERGQYRCDEFYLIAAREGHQGRAYHLGTTELSQNHWSSAETTIFFHSILCAKKAERKFRDQKTGSLTLTAGLFDLVY